MRDVENVTCRACGYAGHPSTFDPSLSVYSDIRCPKCGSTNNEHNSEYLCRLQEGMRDAAK